MTDYFIFFGRNGKYIKGKENIDIGFWSADVRVYFPTFLGISFDVFSCYMIKNGICLFWLTLKLYTFTFLILSMQQKPSKHANFHSNIYTFETRHWNLSISDTYRFRPCHLNYHNKDMAFACCIADIWFNYYIS